MPDSHTAADRLAVGRIRDRVAPHCARIARSEFVQLALAPEMAEESAHAGSDAAGQQICWAAGGMHAERELAALLELSDYTQVMIRVLPPEGGKVAERLLELRDQYEARFRELIDALALPEGADRRYLRLLLMGGLNWSHVWYHPGGDTPAVIAASNDRSSPPAPRPRAWLSQSGSRIIISLAHCPLIPVSLACLLLRDYESAITPLPPEPLSQRSTNSSDLPYQIFPDVVYLIVNYHDA